MFIDIIFFLSVFMMSILYLCSNRISKITSACVFSIVNGTHKLKHVELWNVCDYYVYQNSTSRNLNHPLIYWYMKRYINWHNQLILNIVFWITFQIVTSMIMNSQISNTLIFVFKRCAFCHYINRFWFQSLLFVLALLSIRMEITDRHPIIHI